MSLTNHDETTTIGEGATQQINGERDALMFLPLEIVEQEIIPYLDSFSIQAFLEAFPTLKSDVLLLTDHPYPPVFFKVEGITRRQIPTRDQKSPSDETFYRRKTHKHPIRLVEIINRRPEQRPAFGERDSLAIINTVYEIRQGTEFNIYDDLRYGTSFVFVSSVACGSIRHSLYDKLLGQRIKWHLGLPVLHNTHWRDDVEDGSFPTSRETKAVKDPEAIIDAYKVANHNIWTDFNNPIGSNLRSLTLQTTRVEDLHIPSLRDLCLDLSGVQGAERPLIRNVYAPGLSTFAIKINKRLPVIYTVDIRGYNDQGMFALSDVCGIQFDPQTVDTTAYETSDDVDLSFLSNGFKSLSINGVSNSVLQGVDLSKVETLNWNISLFKPDVKVELQLQSLKNLWVNCTVPHVTLPVFHVSQLDNLSIVVAAPDVRIERALCAIQQPILKNLTILRYEHLIAQPGPIPRLETFWISPLLPDHTCVNFSFLCISGFLMDCVGTKDTVKPLDLIFPDDNHERGDYRTTIAPVLLPEHTHCAIHIRECTWPFGKQLNVVPIPLRRGTRAVLEIQYEEDDDDRKLPWMIKTPLCLEKVIFNGKPLSMERAQKHASVGKILMRELLFIRTAARYRQFYTWTKIMRYCLPRCRMNTSPIFPDLTESGEQTGCHPSYILRAMENEDVLRGCKREGYFEYDE